MTSLLSTIDGRASQRAVADGPSDPRHRRPLVILATLGGVVAAGSVLLVCLAVGVLGWFVSDAGTHGEPRDALQVGALGWLMAHGSGVSVDGVAVTAVPLLLTLLCCLGHVAGGAAGRRLDLGARPQRGRDRRRRARLDGPDGARVLHARLRTRRVS